MGEPKIFASLSPRLLARKGGAKPAMRRQVQPFTEFDTDPGPSSQDDLGWNDLGEDLAAPVTDHAEESESSAQVVAIGSAAPSRDPAVPEVVELQDDLAWRFERRAGASLSPANRRAAFTLRLDPERHLQLRLASTLSGRSAQALMTEALDRMIEDMPDVRALADNARDRSQKSGGNR